MAWKDPFETLVDSTVVDFAAFLSHQANLAPNEQARTQEVCRDFCVYLCKDVHKAKPQDYAIYLQLHAMTVEAEADYNRMLGYIRAFTKEVGQNQDPVAIQMPQPSPRAARKNVGTLQFEPSRELLNDLFNPQVRNTPDVANAFGRGKDFGPDYGAATPERALPAQPEVNHSPDPLDRYRKSSISEGLGQFDFSIDEGLMGPVFEEPNVSGNDHRALQERVFSSGENLLSDRPSTLDAFEKGATDDFSFPEPNYDKSIFSPESFRLEADQIVSGTLRSDQNIPQFDASKHASLRAVDDITYKPQDFEQSRKLAYSQNSTPSVPQGQQHLGFKPYSFNGRYLIDCPLPNPHDYQPLKRDFRQSFFYPLAPTIITLAIAAAAATVSFSIGIVILIFAVILTAIAIPDLGKPAQQTPHASIASYLSAQRGRCYNIAPALIAKKHGDAPPDLHAIWADKVPSAFEALIQRFTRHPLPDIQNVAGSDKQNALVLLFETVQAYHVVPLIRVDGRWYICDPDMPEHKFDENV